MVEQLRTALAERIASAAPSPGAWEGILAKARAPEPRSFGLRAWSSALVGRLRLTALAASTLALVLALNTQVVPMRGPATTDGSLSEQIQLGRVAPRGGSGNRADGGQTVTAEASVTDAVGAFTTTTPLPPSTDEGDEGGSAGAEPATTEVRVVFLAADTYPADWADEPDEEAEEPALVPLASEPGEPS
jgi:hypothetical protein